MGNLLTWDEIGERFYETGVSKTVLYPATNAGGYGPGVAWSGVTGITESPSGAEATPLYADNTKYLNLISNEELSATVEAYTYPDEFAECDGSASLGKGVAIGQQPRKGFCLSYVTQKGNDEAGSDYGYLIHIIYGCKAAPSEKAYTTINDSPEAITFSWEISTTPVNVEGFKPTASITIDSTEIDEAKLAQIEEKLYGKKAEGSGQDVPAAVLLPDQIKAILDAA